MGACTTCAVRLILKPHRPKVNSGLSHELRGPTATGLVMRRQGHRTAARWKPRTKNEVIRASVRSLFRGGAKVRPGLPTSSARMSSSTFREDGQRPSGLCPIRPWPPRGGSKLRSERLRGEARPAARQRSCRYMQQFYRPSLSRSARKGRGLEDSGHRSRSGLPGGAVLDASRPTPELRGAGDGKRPPPSEPALDGLRRSLDWHRPITPTPTPSSPPSVGPHPGWGCRWLSASRRRPAASATRAAPVPWVPGCNDPAPSGSGCTRSGQRRCLVTASPTTARGQPRHQLREFCWSPTHPWRPAVAASGRWIWPSWRRPARWLLERGLSSWNHRTRCGAR